MQIFFEIMRIKVIIFEKDTDKNPELKNLDKVNFSFVKKTAESPGSSSLNNDQI